MLPVRSFMLLVALSPVLVACVSPGRLAAPAVTAEANSVVATEAVPVAEVTSSRSFFVRGPTFPAGQAASLRICVTPAGQISTVELTASSGEPGFDEFALLWARQADVSGWVTKKQKRETCGVVRVEIKRGRPQRLEGGSDSALG